MKAISLVFVVLALVSCDKPVNSFDDPSFIGKKFYRIESAEKLALAKSMGIDVEKEKK